MTDKPRIRVKAISQSTAPSVDRQATAAPVSSTSIGAAVVDNSSPEASATTAPGMALTQNSVDDFSSLSLMNSNCGRVAGDCSAIKCGENWTLGGASSIRDWTSGFPDVTAGETATNSNSGDGLGIHEPRSMTWGGDIVATAPSGRADDSAKCPAVAGSISDALEIPDFLQRNPDNTFRFPTVTSEA